MRVANPRWKREGTIFTKTKIDLLPGHDEAVVGASRNEPVVFQRAQQSSNAATPTPPLASPTETIFEVGPIAVLEQVHKSRTECCFTFAGRYKLVRASFREPRSPDLVRMLEQK